MRPILDAIHQHDRERDILSWRCSMCCGAGLVLFLAALVSAGIGSWVWAAIGGLLAVLCFALGLIYYHRALAHEDAIAALWAEFDAARSEPPDPTDYEAVFRDRGLL